MADLGLRIAVWLQAKVRQHELGLWPRLYVGSACDTQSSCSIRLVTQAAIQVLCFALLNQNFLYLPQDPVPLSINRLHILSTNHSTKTTLEL